MHLFFFQAEDGIRDTSVTGVQTCALPISLWHGRGMAKKRVVVLDPEMAFDRAARHWRRCKRRSEERRVGKEWTTRRWPRRSKETKKGYRARGLYATSSA